jgi:hypothetical protein
MHAVVDCRHARLPATPTTKFSVHEATLELLNRLAPLHDLRLSAPELYLRFVADAVEQVFGCFAWSAAELEQLQQDLAVRPLEP